MVFKKCALAPSLSPGAPSCFKACAHSQPRNGRKEARQDSRVFSVHQGHQN